MPPWRFYYYTQKWLCVTCKRYYRHKDHLIQHLVATYWVHNICTACERDFDSQQNLLYHRANSVRPHYFCAHCPMVYRRRDAIDEHMEEVERRRILKKAKSDEKAAALRSGDDEERKQERNKSEEEKATALRLGDQKEWKRKSEDENAAPLWSGDEEERKRGRSKSEEIVWLGVEKALLTVRIHKAKKEVAKLRMVKTPGWIDSLAANADFMGALDAILGMTGRKRAAEDSDNEDVCRRSKKVSV
jgi:hypothetical protein